jgi:hypothetical protein
MFICDKCVTNNYEPIFYYSIHSHSYGPCEDCGEIAVCTDVHHSQLKAKAATPEKNPNQSPEPQRP